MAEATLESDLPRGDTDFFGHPRGLAWLSMTELWERFSYYGMQALLVLYMTHRLLTPGHMEHIIGFAAFRHILEGAYGPLSTLALSSSIFGLYTGCVWLTPILGGMVADRWTGKTVAITAGAVMMCAGHLLMAVEPAFLIALVCLLLGIGLFKGNLASQVGSLYAPDDPRAASAFQIYNFGIQIGCIITPIVCGTLGEVLGWHWGFGAAGVGMIFGLCIYLRGRRWLPPEPPRIRSGTVKSPLSQLDLKKVAVMVALVPVLALAQVGAMQIGNAYVVWGEAHFQLHLVGFEVPVTWLQSMDGITAALTVLISLAFWRGWERRRGAVNEVTKLIVGTGFMIAAPVVLAVASLEASVTHQRVSLLYAPLFGLLVNTGWANISPVSMALFSRSSPRGLASTIMG